MVSFKKGYMRSGRVGIFQCWCEDGVVLFCFICVVLFNGCKCMVSGKRGE